jgi:hypothetical protein
LAILCYYDYPGSPPWLNDGRCCVSRRLNGLSGSAAKRRAARRIYQKSPKLFQVELCSHCPVSVSAITLWSQGRAAVGTRCSAAIRGEQRAHADVRRRAPEVSCDPGVEGERAMMPRFGKLAIPALFFFLIPVFHPGTRPTPAAFAAGPAQRAANGLAEMLFKDDFEKPGSTIDAAKWRVSKTVDKDVIEVRHNGWPNAGGFAVITDSGDQGGSYHGHASAIATQMSFRRGRNLRCTFKVAMPAHTGTGFSGPWHSTNVMVHEKYAVLNYMTGSVGVYSNGVYQSPFMEWDENNHDFDKNLPAGGYLSGPRLTNGHLPSLRGRKASFAGMVARSL